MDTVRGEGRRGEEGGGGGEGRGGGDYATVTTEKNTHMISDCAKRDTVA